VNIWMSSSPLTGTREPEAVKQFLQSSDEESGGCMRAYVCMNVCMCAYVQVYVNLRGCARMFYACA